MAPMMHEELPSVAAPPELWRQVIEAVISYSAKLKGRDGGGAPSPQMLAMLRQMDAAAGMSASRHPSATIDGTRWITVTEAAPLAGVSERSVQRLAAKGRLITRRHGQRVLLVDADSAGSYGRERRHASADDD